MAEADGKIVYEVRADYDKLSGDLDGATAQVEKGTSKWSGLLQGVGQGIGSFVAGKAIEAAAAIYEMGTAFEDGMAKVSTLVDTAQVDMDELGDSLLDLSAKYGLEADGLAESAYNAISANNALGKDTEGLMALLDSSAQLAKAGFTDLDTATSATLKTLNAYGLGVEEADRIQKILIQTQNTGITTVGELGSVLSNVTPTAAAMGVSFENVGAAIATMTAQGTPAAQATTQLNSLMAELGKQGTQASLGLAEAAEGTQYAGMSFQDMTAAGVPLNDIVGLLEQSAQKNGKTMLDMFSSIEAGKAALAITGAGAETFTGNLEAMSTQTDVVGEGFEKVAGTSSEKLNRSLTQLKNLGIQLWQAISPLVSVLIDLAGTIMGPVVKAVGWFIDKLSVLIGWVSKAVGAVGSFFSNLFGGGGSSHAVGLDFVPVDGYPAVLHRGEAVLTAAEAKVWREGGNSRAGSLTGGGGGGGIDYERLARAMSGLTVVMDGQAVGRLVEPTVSSAQARKVESMQRSGFNGRV